jgi:chromosome segregation ATPase
MQLRTLKQEQKEVGALLNKFQKAQDELKQYRREVEDLDTKGVAIEHERAGLEKTVNALAEKVEEAKKNLESLKAQHEADLEELRQTHQQHLDALGEAAASEEQRDIAAVKADAEKRQEEEKKKATEDKKVQKQKSKPLKEVTNNETTKLVVEELRRDLSEKTKEQEELKTVLAELDEKLKASKENEAKLGDLSEQLLKNMHQVSAVKMAERPGLPARPRVRQALKGARAGTSTSCSLAYRRLESPHCYVSCCRTTTATQWRSSTSPLTR